MGCGGELDLALNLERASCNVQDVQWSAMLHAVHTVHTADPTPTCKQ